MWFHNSQLEQRTPLLAVVAVYPINRAVPTLGHLSDNLS